MLATIGWMVADVGGGVKFSDLQKGLRDAEAGPVDHTFLYASLVIAAIVVVVMIVGKATEGWDWDAVLGRMLEMFERPFLAGRGAGEQGSAEAVKFVPVMCPNLKCRSVLMVPEEARGKTVRCGSCKGLVRVPTQRAPRMAFLNLGRETLLMRRGRHRRYRAMFGK